MAARMQDTGENMAENDRRKEGSGSGSWKRGEILKRRVVLGKGLRGNP